jgi:signal transduction histidine kinase
VARRSLRRTLITAIALLAMLATIVAATLVLVTTLFHRANHEVTDSVESTHLCDEALYDLLRASRAGSHFGEVAHELRVEIGDAQRYVSTDEEAGLLAQATADLDVYLAAPDDASLEVARASLGKLADLNLEQAREAGGEVARWDRLATVVAWIAVALVLALVIAVARWLLWRAFEPVAALAGAMERFGRGEHDARAGIAGAAELADMARQFNTMADAIARQRDRQMAFVAGIAHDLRNPIGVLRLRLDTLRASAVDQHGFESATRQLGRLERMLDDFLDAARIEAGRLELHLEPCDLRRVAKDVVEMFTQGSPQHTLVLELPDSAAPVDGDPMRLEQVLTNLVSNAIKYSPDGGTIQVTVTPGAIAVRDPGLGIDDEARAHLFEPFVRAHRGHHEIPGVGLGLSICRRIVTRHGGDIEVASAPGRGSTFTVRIPEKK